MRQQGAALSTSNVGFNMPNTAETTTATKGSCSHTPDPSLGKNHVTNNLIKIQDVYKEG